MPTLGYLANIKGASNGDPRHQQRVRSDPNALYNQFIGADDAGRYDMLSGAGGVGRAQALRTGFLNAGGLAPEDFNPVINQYAGGARPTGGGQTPLAASPGSLSPTGATAPAAGGWGSAPMDGGMGTAGSGASPIGAAGAPATDNKTWGSTYAGSNLGSPGYGVNVSDYLDPSMRYQMDEAQRVLENSAAANGMLGSGQTLRDLTQLATNMASTDFGGAWNRATNARDFNYGVDSADRAFDYGVSRDDRNFDYQRLSDLARLGLSGAGTAASGDNALSGILAGILSNAGQIQGTGQIGAANGINSNISGILNYLLQNNLISSLGAR